MDDRYPCFPARSSKPVSTRVSRRRKVVPLFRWTRPATTRRSRTSEVDEKAFRTATARTTDWTVYERLRSGYFPTLREESGSISRNSLASPSTSRTKVRFGVYLNLGIEDFVRRSLFVLSRKTK